MSKSPWEEDIKSAVRNAKKKRFSSLDNDGMSPKSIFKFAILGILVLTGIWLGSGFYRVDSDEKGVVLRFGKWTKTTGPGLHYALPWPVEKVFLPKVTKVNRLDIGFRDSINGTILDVKEESLVLTGDENIVDIDLSVFWVIQDPRQYLFNVESPGNNVKAVAESILREVAGKEKIQSILTSERKRVEREVQQKLQGTLDEYKAGIRITEVKLQKVDPPGVVIDSFRDVQAAAADRERARNEAEAYANSILPQARGQAKRITEEAIAYKEEQIADAEGKSSRYQMILNEYLKEPRVVKTRMRLKVLEDIMRRHKILVIPNAGNGVNSYIPLNELMPQLKARVEKSKK